MDSPAAAAPATSELVPVQREPSPASGERVAEEREAGAAAAGEGPAGEAPAADSEAQESSDAAPARADILVVEHSSEGGEGGAAAAAAPSLAASGSILDLAAESSDLLEVGARRMGLLRVGCGQQRRCHSDECRQGLPDAGLGSALEGPPLSDASRGSAALPAPLQGSAAPARKLTAEAFEDETEAEAEEALSETIKALRLGAAEPAGGLRHPAVPASEVKAGGGLAPDGSTGSPRTVPRKLPVQGAGSGGQAGAAANCIWSALGSGLGARGGRQAAQKAPPC